MNRIGTILAVGLLAVGCASTRQRQVVATERAPRAIGPYSQGVRAGEFVFLSGQLGIDPASGQLAAGGIEAETRQALENCREVLAAAGLSLADVVQVQVLLADIADYATMNQVYATYFPVDPPARAAYAAAALPRGARVEILMTAYARQGGGAPRPEP